MTPVLPAGNVLLTSLSPGLYVLGVSPFDFDPVDSSNVLIFPSTPHEGVFGPSNLNPLDHWQLPFETFGNVYTMSLTGAEFAVPEPSTAILVGTALLVMLAAKRRY